MKKFSKSHINYVANPAFIKAVKSRSVSKVKKALENGADVNLIGFRGSRTALAYASKIGDHEIVSLLLKYDPSNKGQALREAVSIDQNEIFTDGRLKCAQLLIKAGADVNYGDEWYTVLNMAFRYELYSIIDDLLIHGADIHRGDGLSTPYDKIIKLPSVQRDHYLKLAGEAPLTVAPLQEGDSYEKLSEVELLKTSVSPSGIKLMTIFNFETRDIRRTEYVPGEQTAPPERFRFSELDNPEALRPMFDKLVELEGNPPKDALDVRPFVPVPKKVDKLSF